MKCLIQRTLFRFTEASKKFQIYRSKYLIPIKPKRPLTAYFVFSNEQRQKFAGQGSISEIATKLGLQWKAMPQQQKIKYLEIAQKQSQRYKPLQQAYEQKYVKPFKRISLNNLVMKRLSQSHKFSNITEGTNKLKQYMAGLSPEDKKILQDQVESIKQKKQKILAEFHIPEPEYKTQRSYMMRQAGEKRLSQLTESQRNKLSQGYQKYLIRYQKTLGTFASKFNLSQMELADVIKRHQRKLRREKSSQDNLEVLNTPPAKKVAKKKALTTKKSPTGNKKATTGAKRVTKGATTAKKVATEAAKTVEA